MHEREEGFTGVAYRHDVTIQISDTEFERLRQGELLFAARDDGQSSFSERLQEAARLLPRPIRVGDMVDPDDPGHRIAGRRWPAEVVAIRDQVAWLWFADHAGDKSGIWLLSDLVVSDV